MNGVPSRRTTAVTVASDRFRSHRSRGTVTGSSDPGGPVRHGVDIEGALAVDEGGLRIATMVDPGWGRTGVSYGPYERRAGRLLHVHLLNGHNTSDSSPVGALWRRAARWLRGSEVLPSWRRLVRYPSSRPREWLPRKLRSWWRNRDERVAPLLENLMVGWSGGRVPHGPTDRASMHVVRATGPYNGELTTTVLGHLVQAFRGLQNLPIHYVSVLRPVGVLHLAASDYDAVRGLPRHPRYRPIAIDPGPLPEQLFAGLHQGTTGQIGFSCDSRVYAVDIVDDPELAAWCTTAAIADAFSAETAASGDGDSGSSGSESSGSTGAVPVGGRCAERGGRWVAHGAVVVDAAGLGLLIAADGSGSGAVELDGEHGALGLIHCTVDGLEQGERVVLGWDGACSQPHRWVELRPDSIAVGAGDDALHRWSVALHGATRAVQVCDDGDVVAVSVDGRSIGRATLPAAAGAAGLRVELHGHGSARVRDLEAHERTVTLDGLAKPTVAPLPFGGEVVFEERFERVCTDLHHDGRSSTDGGVRPGALAWRRVQGDGRIEVTAPGCAHFVASVEAPMPNRTIHVVDWADPRYCDLELHAAPPAASGAGSGHRCRAGLTVWQDERTYFSVSIYLDEAYPSASASSFFTFRGFEDVYDAVWSNLGDLVSWHDPFRLRLVCDGSRYLVVVNGEPVLYRAFQDVHPATRSLDVRKVGVVSAWEWGHDTGSTLQRITARGRPVPGPGVGRAQGSVGSGLGRERR